MTLSVFNPPRTCDQGAGVAVKPAVLMSAMGDGYVQRAANGINTMLRKMTLSWTNLSKADCATIIAFFEGQYGVIPFFWTPIGETKQRVWVCSEWEFKELSGGYATISKAMFEEAAGS